MKHLVTGVGCLSAAGRGSGALPALLGGRAFSELPPYEAEGLYAPSCGRVDVERDRPAEALLREAVAEALAQARFEGRLGLVVGTSSGNICGPWERWHRALLEGEPGSEEGTWRQDPTRAIAEELGALRHATVSVACASGTAGFVLAQGWLEEGLVDGVLVCGVDALSLYVHAGFNGLGALSRSRPRPFHAERDGLLLGEGAAAILVEADAHCWARGATPIAELCGTGLSADGVHMTAPDREGRGAARAMAAALADAGVEPDRVDLVSVHGTGTVFNDAMEAHALQRVFGGRPLPLFGVKQAVGHTLGAAGAVEATVVVEALQSGQAPPAPEVDSELPVLARRFPDRPTVAISTNSAFGGANAAAVLALPGVVEVPQRRRVLVHEVARARVEVPAGRAEWPWEDPPERFKRMNRYCRVVLCAMKRLFERVEPTEDTGVVLASESNCRATDLRYHQKLVQRGAAQAPRVEFIYTIPGAPSGEAAILWKLRGPSMVLCDPMSVGLEEAARMIRHGRASRLVVVGVEAPEPRGAAWAEAVMLSR